MTRYRVEGPTTVGPPHVGRILLWSLVAVAMVVVSFVAGLYLWFHESVAAIQAHSQDVKSAQKFLGEPPAPGHAAIGLVIGYDHRANEAANTPSRSDTVMLIRTGPREEDGLDDVLPPRPAGQRALPGTAGLLGEDQFGLRGVRGEGDRPDGQRHDRPADQLPDHGQLPGVQADRQQARGRLDRRRSPVLQRQCRSFADVRLREDQPAARLPAAQRRQRPRLRPLSPHRLRPVPRRPPAAVREGDEVPVHPQLQRAEGAEDRRDADQEHRGRRGPRKRRSRAAPSSAMRSSRTTCRRATSSRRRSRG